MSEQLVWTERDITPDAIYELIGRRIASGLSRKAIAEASGLSRKKIRHFENHPGAARITTAQRYARALGLKIESKAGLIEDCIIKTEIPDTVCGPALDEVPVGTRVAQLDGFNKPAPPNYWERTIDGWISDSEFKTLALPDYGTPRPVLRWGLDGDTIQHSAVRTVGVTRGSDH